MGALRPGSRLASPRALALAGSARAGGAVALCRRLSGRRVLPTSRCVALRLFAFALGSAGSARLERAAPSPSGAPFRSVGARGLLSPPPCCSGTFSPLPIARHWRVSGVSPARSIASFEARLVAMSADVGRLQERPVLYKQGIAQVKVRGSVSSSSSRPSDSVLCPFFDQPRYPSNAFTGWISAL